MNSGCSGCQVSAYIDCPQLYADHWKHELPTPLSTVVFGTLVYMITQFQRFTNSKMFWPIRRDGANEKFKPYYRYVSRLLVFWLR